MAESTATNVETGGTAAVASPGTAGLNSQVQGQAVTVSAAAQATGGIAPGNYIDVDIDKELAEFRSDETPLMQLMLKAKSQKVNSPEIRHFSVDLPRSQVITTSAVGTGATETVILPLANADKKMLQPYTTALVKGVNGYTSDGQTATPGKELMIFVKSFDTTTGNPVVMAVNGAKTNATDNTCLMPAIPAGTTVIVLGNAMFETQKMVPPDMVVPSPELVYAQKRGMSRVVSDYFQAQAKGAPFTEAAMARQQIRNFKCKSNRTLWAGRRGKFVVDTELGQQTIYTSEGIRWSIKRHLDHKGPWTYAELIALMKMTYTGDDVPRNVICLCGKNFLENIQSIDLSKHPNVKIDVKMNERFGWKLSTFFCTFGELEFKHDPALDRLGWSNSAAIIDYDRLAHYTYSAEHKASDRVDGHEASREDTVVWDCLALKGGAHMWIDGEGGEEAEGATSFELWEAATAPTTPVKDRVYILVVDCPGINANAKKGETWVHDGTSWSEYTGTITV